MPKGVPLAWPSTTPRDHSGEIIETVQSQLFVLRSRKPDEKPVRIGTGLYGAVEDPSQQYRRLISRARKQETSDGANSSNPSSAAPSSTPAPAAAPQIHRRKEAQKPGEIAGEQYHIDP